MTISKKGDLAPEDEGAKSFASTLTGAEDGQYHADLTREAQKLLMFASEVTDPNGAPLPVPGAFLLAIPVFKRGDLYPVPVRLRFRIKDSIVWSYELARVDTVFEHAFGEACDHVAKATSLPVLRGTPER